MSGSGLITFLYLACGLFFFLLGLTILRIGRSSAPTRAAAMMLFFARTSDDGEIKDYLYACGNHGDQSKLRKCPNASSTPRLA